MLGSPPNLVFVLGERSQKVDRQHHVSEVVARSGSRVEGFKRGGVEDRKRGRKGYQTA